MGYRLYCRDADNENSEVCYGKLYGYIEPDVEELDSFKYLVGISKLEEDDAITMECACGIVITKLTAEEYRRFIDLYEEEYEKHSGEMWFRKGEYEKYPRNEEKDELYKRDTKKIIEWG